MSHKYTSRDLAAVGNGAPCTWCNKYITSAEAAVALDEHRSLWHEGRRIRRSNGKEFWLRRGYVHDDCNDIILKERKHVQQVEQAEPHRGKAKRLLERGAKRAEQDRWRARQADEDARLHALYKSPLYQFRKRRHQSLRDLWDKRAKDTAFWAAAHETADRLERDKDFWDSVNALLDKKEKR